MGTGGFVAPCIMYYLIKIHLGRGKNYGHWQIKDSNGDVKYIDPEDASLIMKNCKLINRKSTAKKIFYGGNKTPCSWVKCAIIEIVPSASTYPLSRKLTYSPRISPTWQQWDQNDLINEDVDGQYFDWIHSVGKELFILGA